MKRLVIIVFVIVGLSLGLAFLLKDAGDNTSQSITPSQTVIPQTTEQKQESVDIHIEEVDETLISLVPLYNEETLMDTLNVDFDGDGYDDQINTIRKMTSPYIQILVGLYNPYKGQYERSAIIDTEIIQTRTFNYSCLDLIGNHKNVLMFSGFLENNNSVMKLFLPEKRDTGLVMNVIGDFQSDGTIFIQQLDRHESYESQKANGISFPVWVYSSDSNSGNSLDQIQTKYVWDSSANKYTRNSETRVQESKVTSTELNKILDGTLVSFQNHLEGLWYNTNASADEAQYMFFNPRDEEIIFQADKSQEVYTWVSSTLRRNGIYITAINSSINNLTRRIDISLTGIDEIRVRNQDDVLMTISEKSLWDGEYKKQPLNNSSQTTQPAQEILHLLEGQKHWLVEGVNQMEITGGIYSSSLVTGMITSTFCDNQEVIQVRGSVGAPFYNQESYLATVEHDEETKLLKAVRLSPVKITPLGIESLGGSTIRLEANYNVQEEAVAELISPDEPELQATSSHDGDESRPVLSVHTSPRYFSPDNDGVDDKLTIDLSVTSGTPIASWSFNIYDPSNNSLIWSRSGIGEVNDKLEWNGRTNTGELVQSATDYPFTFSAKDENGMSSEARGELSVDVLVIHEGHLLKIQVPSIIFRSDSADFVGKDVDSKKGLDQATIDNNIKVIQRIAQILNKFPDYRVRIEGHANNITGTEAEETSTANGNIPLVPLSKARADLVRDMLIESGVDGNRLSTVGMGGRQPVVSRSDKPNWWKNRRVEFILEK